MQGNSVQSLYLNGPVGIVCRKFSVQNIFLQLSLSFLQCWVPEHQFPSLPEGLLGLGKNLGG